MSPPQIEGEIMIKECDILVKRSHPEPTEDGLGTRWVQEEPVRETVTIEVDFAKIAARLGPKACCSKSGKSTYLHGLIIVKKARTK